MNSAITNATKHCPGPWRVVARKNARGQELTPCVVAPRTYTSRPGPVAVLTAISHAETNANARLIAAAPDLLTACEAALNDRMYKDWPGIADLLKAAIAKAKGE